MRLRNVLLLILIQVMLMACITKPPPWRPDSWFEVKKEIFSEVKDGMCLCCVDMTL